MLILFEAPVGNASGYGQRARDVVRALKQTGHDVRILNRPWGMLADNRMPAEYADLVVPESLAMSLQPDIHMQLTIPNEFRPLGKYNIGMTAGIECNKVAPSWLAGANRMNEVWVSSEWSAKGLRDTVYTHGTQRLALEVPVHVVHEGVNTDIYNHAALIDVALRNTLKKITEPKIVLFVGHWLHGALGEDRKDVGTLAASFMQAFPKGSGVALLMKTGGGGDSYTDALQVLGKLNFLKRRIGKAAGSVYILHGELTDGEMAGLYNSKRVVATVSFTHGEGYGRPLAEAAACGKPVLAGKWTGQADFLISNELALDGQAVDVPASQWNENTFVRGTQWFQVQPEPAMKKLADVISRPEKYSSAVSETRRHVTSHKNIAAMQERISDLLVSAAAKVEKIAEQQRAEHVKIDIDNIQLERIP